MDHLKGQSTVFNQRKFYFKILMQYKVIVNIVNGDGQKFHEIFKIFVVMNQKPGIYGAKNLYG